MPRLKEINPDLIEAITQLYWWQYSSDTTNFSSLLYRMFQKADASNLQKLRRGFPAQYMAWKLWNSFGDQDHFFKTWLGEDFFNTLRGENNAGHRTEN